MRVERAALAHARQQPTSNSDASAMTTLLNNSTEDGLYDNHNQHHQQQQPPLLQVFCPAQLDPAEIPHTQPNTHHHHHQHRHQQHHNHHHNPHHSDTLSSLIEAPDHSNLNSIRAAAPLLDLADPTNVFDAVLPEQDHSEDVSDPHHHHQQQQQQQHHRRIDHNHQLVQSSPHDSALSEAESSSRFDEVVVAAAGGAPALTAAAAAAAATALGEKHDDELDRIFVDVRASPSTEHEQQRDEDSPYSISVKAASSTNGDGVDATATINTNSKKKSNTRKTASVCVATAAGSAAIITNGCSNNTTDVPRTLPSEVLVYFRERAAAAKDDKDAHEAMNCDNFALRQSEIVAHVSSVYDKLRKPDGNRYKSEVARAVVATLSSTGLFERRPNNCWVVRECAVEDFAQRERARLAKRNSMKRNRSGGSACEEDARVRFERFHAMMERVGSECGKRKKAWRAAGVFDDPFVSLSGAESAADLLKAVGRDKFAVMMQMHAFYASAAAQQHAPAAAANNGVGLESEQREEAAKRHRLWD